MATYETVCTCAGVTEGPEARWAWEQLRQATFDRVLRQEVEPAQLTDVFAELAECYKGYEAEGRKAVASETVGSWSRTYATANSASAERQLRTQAAGIINWWLGGSGLLYRGMDYV